MPIHLSSADGDEEERLTGDITFNFSKVSSPHGDTDAAGRRYESLQLPVCASRFIAAAPFKARQATLPDRTLVEQSLTGSFLPCLQEIGSDRTGMSAVTICQK